MSAINELLSLGADAYKNIYDVLITFPLKAAESITGPNSSSDYETAALQVSVRCNEFAIPKYATAESERKYKGVTIKKPKPEEDFTREFELTFRMDASYGLYEKFCNWQNKVVGPNGQVSNWMSWLGQVEVIAATGEYIADSTSDSSIFDSSASIGEDNYGNAVNATGDEREKSKIWRFQNVWVSDVGKPEFSNSDSGEITYTVKFNFTHSAYGSTNGDMTY